MCGSSEDDSSNLVDMLEKRVHDDNQRCFLVEINTCRKGLWQNGYGDECSIYSTTTKKVKVIMKKCKKLMNGRKIEESRDYVIKNAKSCERMKKETFKNWEVKQTSECDTDKSIDFLCLAVVVGDG